MTKRGSGTSDPVLNELESIKRLMVLSLLKNGANQGEIAAALGIDRSQVSRMFPGGTGKILKRNANSG